MTDANKTKLNQLLDEAEKALEKAQLLSKAQGDLTQADQILKDYLATVKIIDLVPPEESDHVLYKKEAWEHILPALETTLDQREDLLHDLVFFGMMAERYPWLAKYIERVTEFVISIM